MSKAKSVIVKYLSDNKFYHLKSQEILSERRYTNYYCRRNDGVKIPLKELGDLFGLFDDFNDDHTNKLIPQLLDMSITIYAKRKYKTIEKKYKWAIEKNLLVFENEN
ncbi:hypothetical protein [Fictibacillus halophilus]|uniref:hypothetical protein n=1 Tax=Fictibacillus halophilus TaxID=1610490 RepID=UPI001CFB1CAB|nr:hypothetical protein [Fictibacillus halophilus]